MPTASPRGCAKPGCPSRGTRLKDDLGRKSDGAVAQFSLFDGGRGGTGKPLSYTDTRSRRTPMDGTAQLLESDRRFLVHPLHHPEEHKTPLLVTEGAARCCISPTGARSSTGWPGCGTSMSGMAAANWPMPPPGRCARSPMPRPMSAPPTSRRSDWARRSSSTPTPTARRSITRPAAPNRTSPPSRPRAFSGRCRTSRKRPSSSRACTAITASRWRR